MRRRMSTVMVTRAMLLPQRWPRGHFWACCLGDWFRAIARGRLISRLLRRAIQYSIQYCTVLYSSTLRIQATNEPHSLQ